MAWRVCIHPGCNKSKPIQPWGTTTVHAWLCPTHRRQRLAESQRRPTAKEKRAALAGVMSGKKSAAVFRTPRRIFQPHLLIKMA